MPTALSVNLGAFVGSLIYYLIPLRRRILRGNLDIAFGDTMSSDEKKRLMREAYKYLVILAIETFYVQYASVDWPEKRITESEGMEHLRNLQANGSKFISVGGHFGNWEILGAHGKHLFPAAVVAKPLHNPLVQKEVRHSRERHGLEIIWTGRKETIRDVISVIQKGDRQLNMMIDQDARMGGVFVPFFGREASTQPLPALMAIRNDIPLLPAFLVRVGMTRHRLVFREPIYPPQDPHLTRDQKVELMMKQATSLIEDMVRLYPAQYFWFHRRWRTTPRQVERRLEKLKRKRLEKRKLLDSTVSPERDERELAKKEVV